ncbi:MAG: hypothetical protein JWP30_861, partial [Homoserinimonas sp.]|nr:hypothetical protein [Homoserinimonas sp.]
GETSYPVLQKVLVSFGDAIAFESTLDAALDVIFGGDSGAVAGDGDVPNVPVDPEAPTTPTDPAAPTTPTEPGAGGGTPFEQALADAQAALIEREAAYAAGDRVAEAEADERLQDALERLFRTAE